MTEEETHDLIRYINNLSSALDLEYQEIKRRVKEDPGTAGQHAERAWAKLLDNVLPPYYRVVTGGRLIDQNGATSPQIDILVLRPSYPNFLVDKGYYLVDGVIAAFECKMTLRNEHVPKIVKTGMIIRDLVTKKKGTTYSELNSPILYGILANTSEHSEKENALESFNRSLEDILNPILRPDQAVDLICVADLAALSIMKRAGLEPFSTSMLLADLKVFVQLISFDKEYPRHVDAEQPLRMITPLATMLANLLYKISWQDVELRRISKFFDGTRPYPSGVFPAQRSWPAAHVLSQDVLRSFTDGRAENRGGWYEWDNTFF